MSDSSCHLAIRSRTGVTVRIRRCIAPLQANLVRALIARCDLPSEEENQPGSYIATMELVGQTAYEASVIDSIRRDLLRLQRKYENTALLFALAEEVFAGKE